MTARRPLDVLRRRVAEVGAPLCLGVDPHPDHLPAGLTRDVAGIEAFARGVIEAAGPYVAAVKLNSAFYEAHGSAGWAALERVRAAIPDELFVVIDAKRGDIPSTAERYAAALFGHLGADAVTASAYLGADAVEPFLAWEGRVVYLLVRTSNPGAAAIQGLAVDGGQPLSERIAAWATATWPTDRLGLVVGATAPDDLRALRRAFPQPPFLVPGIGAQGGDLVAAVESCHGTRAPGLVAVSRAIAGASPGSDWQRAAAAAARAMRDRMHDAGATLTA